MPDLKRPVVAEFIGTFALVFIGGATIMNGYVAKAAVPLIDVAIAHGLIFALLITATMRVSGHLNPAVTIGVAVTRRLSAPHAVAYVVAQCAGAVAAALALKAIFPADAATASRLGAQWVAGNVSTTAAIALEGIATFFLVFVFFGTVVDPRGPKVGGFATGLTVTAGILAIGPLTGASMNPARSFGPALVSGYFEGHLIYWIGPLLGGALAGLLYDRVFLHGEPASRGA
ncbi:MAG: aquaporin [Gemmatimonadota bacterium]|nr:aquaporin [Gemmatimonadota bacterium]HEU4990455.1 aquaporin [Gemmatimonadaceae bacterium]